MPWYIGGIILVTFTFLPIYLPLIKIDPQNLTIGDYIYYISFPSIFNIGWASV
jgi:hypothetical protein